MCKECSKPGVMDFLVEYFADQNEAIVQPRTWAKIGGWSSVAYLNNFTQMSSGFLPNRGWVFECNGKRTGEGLMGSDIPDGAVVKVIKRPGPPVPESVTLDAPQDVMERFLDAWHEAQKAKLRTGS